MYLSHYGLVYFNILLLSIFSHKISYNDRSFTTIYSVLAYLYIFSVFTIIPCTLQTENMKN